MNFEEYKGNLNGETIFAPGLDAINEELNRIYTTTEPESYSLLNPSKAIFGNTNNSLEGFAVYNSPSLQEHKHVISYGFSQLYGSEHYFMREKSKCGYELTFRTLEQDEAKLKDILTVMDNIYKLNKQTSIYLEENTFIDYREHISETARFAGFIVTKDKQLNSLDTIHGKVDFLQLYPIDSCTVSALKSGKFKIEDIIEVLEEDNDLLIYKR